MERKPHRFNKAGIDNSCEVWSCKCHQGKASPLDKTICVCGHAHFFHRIVFKNWKKFKKQVGIS